MTNDSTPPPPPPTSADKLIPFSITNKVPVKLNLEKHNYTSWSSFFKIHLGSLGLKSHIENKPNEASSSDPEWCKLDDLIKMWILGSLCESLQEQVVSTPGNAKDLWDHLEKLFHDNKDARAINLDNELRSIKIGNLSINEYCTKIQSMADRLKNLGSSVSEKNLVIYAVNGLDSRFTTIVKIIRHREPLPTFETARNMLLLEESTLHEAVTNTTTFDSSSSAPTVLMATKTGNKGNNFNKSESLPQLCNHFNKGTCKFGDRCKFIHDHRNRVGLTTKLNGGNNSDRTIYQTPHNCNNYTVANQSQSWTPPGLYQARAAQQQILQTQRLANQNNHQAFVTPMLLAQSNQLQNTQAQYPSTVHQFQQQPNSNGILGPAPALYPSQATSLPSAFSTMTLQDPTWNMDTGLLDSPYPPSM